MNTSFVMFCHTICTIAIYICFAFLAITFNKWWIILFVLFANTDISINTDSLEDEEEDDEE